MAKKKAAPKAKKTATKKPTAPKKAAAAKSTKAGPAAPTLTSPEIGVTAGQVWQVLADRGEQTTAALKKAVDAPGDMVMAAVGWLAREEKLDFDTIGRTVKISLR